MDQKLLDQYWRYQKAFEACRALAEKWEAEGHLVSWSFAQEVRRAIGEPERSFEAKE